MKRIIEILNEPYPDRDDLPSILKGSLIGGLAVVFVLAGLKPFGMHQAGSKLIIYALTFGFITFLVSVCLELFVKHILKLQKDHPSWTLWKWITYILVALALIGTANYFYTINLIPNS
ncbi:MAG: hypothetical protein AAGK97_07710, partial [Bacteroidota bacterium]